MCIVFWGQCLWYLAIEFRVTFNSNAIEIEMIDQITFVSYRILKGAARRVQQWHQAQNQQNLTQQWRPSCQRFYHSQMIHTFHTHFLLMYILLLMWEVRKYVNKVLSENNAYFCLKYTMNIFWPYLFKYGDKFFVFVISESLQISILYCLFGGVSMFLCNSYFNYFSNYIN